MGDYLLYNYRMGQAFLIITKKKSKNKRESTLIIILKNKINWQKAEDF